MASTTLSPIPRVLQIKTISPSDPNPCPLCAAASGKAVKYWAGEFSNVNSITFLSDTTPLSTAMQTDAIDHPLPSGNLADRAFPRFQSDVGQTINIFREATALYATVYYTQD